MEYANIGTIKLHFNKKIIAERLMGLSEPE